MVVIATPSGFVSTATPEKVTLGSSKVGRVIARSRRRGGGGRSGTSQEEGVSSAFTKEQLEQQRIQKEQERQRTLEQERQRQEKIQSQTIAGQQEKGVLTFTEKEFAGLKRTPSDTPIFYVPRDTTPQDAVNIGTGLSSVYLTPRVRGQGSIQPQSGVFSRQASVSAFQQALINPQLSDEDLTKLGKRQAKVILSRRDKKDISASRFKEVSIGQQQALIGIPQFALDVVQEFGTGGRIEFDSEGKRIKQKRIELDIGNIRKQPTGPGTILGQVGVGAILGGAGGKSFIKDVKQSGFIGATRKNLQFTTPLSPKPNTFLPSQGETFESISVVNRGDITKVGSISRGSEGSKILTRESVITQGEYQLGVSKTLNVNRIARVTGERGLEFGKGFQLSEAVSISKTGQGRISRDFGNIGVTSTKELGFGTTKTLQRTRGTATIFNKEININLNPRGQFNLANPTSTGFNNLNNGKISSFVSGKRSDVVTKDGGLSTGLKREDIKLSGFQIDLPSRTSFRPSSRGSSSVRPIETTQSSIISTLENRQISQGSLTSGVGRTRQIPKVSSITNTKTTTRDFTIQRPRQNIPQKNIIATREDFITNTITSPAFKPNIKTKSKSKVKTATTTITNVDRAIIPRTDTTPAFNPGIIKGGRSVNTLLTFENTFRKPPRVPTPPRTPFIPKIGIPGVKPLGFDTSFGIGGKKSKSKRGRISPSLTGISSFDIAGITGKELQSRSSFDITPRFLEGKKKRKKKR